MLAPGTQVRLKANPGRVGVATGKNDERYGVIRWETVFPTDKLYVPEDQLEIVPDTVDPLEQIKAGRFGRPSDLRRNLTYIRLSGRLADVIYSMGTTNTDFYAYQFKPVINFLNSPGKGILIADEVGLGKTIEAGLIWTELRSRYDSRKLLVLCPAVLRDKWKIELEERFGIEGQIAKAKEVQDAFQQARQDGDFASFALIGSFQGLRPNRGWDNEDKPSRESADNLARFLDENSVEEPLVDLLIIDEAHYLKNPETMTAKLARLLRSVAEHIVLLTATPIHLKNEDLYSLLNIVDEDTYDRPDVLHAVLEANKPIVAARESLFSKERKAESIVQFLQQAKNHHLLEGNRQIQSLLDEPPTDDLMVDHHYVSMLSHRLETVNLLSNVVSRTRKREVQEWRVIRHVIAEEIELTPAEVAFYDGVTAIVREYCGRYEKHEGFLLAMPQRQISSSMAAALRNWQQRHETVLGEQVHEDIGQQESDVYKPGPLVTELIQKAHAMGNLEELTKHDSKFNRLKKILVTLLHENPEEKIVLFSYFKPTLSYLQERLDHVNVTSVILSGDSTLDKKEILNIFKSRTGPSVLLSSEVGSEGVDLQFSRVMINYDLPWNPMKVEQRIGRIDRLGQAADQIIIWNLFSQNTIDARIYTRLYQRLKLFETSLGGFEAVLGDEIRKLTMDLFRGQLTPAQEEARIQQTAQAIENNRQTEERLESQASNLVAHGDYILNQIKASKELNRVVLGMDLWIYTRDFFNTYYTNCHFAQVKEDILEFDVKLSPEAKYDVDAFIREHRLHGLTRLVRASAQVVRCRFENRVTIERAGQLEIISQFHPLIRFITYTLAAKGETFYPTVSIRLAKRHLSQLGSGTYIFTVAIWSTKGIENREKMSYGALNYPSGDQLQNPIDAERLILSAVLNGEDWPDASSLIDTGRAKELASESFKTAYAEYERNIRQMKAENNDRADILQKSLDQHLSNQMEKLNAMIESVREKGYESLVKANEKKIEILKEKVLRKKKEIESSRTVHPMFREVSAGIISIY